MLCEGKTTGSLMVSDIILSPVSQLSLQHPHCKTLVQIS